MIQDLITLDQALLVAINGCHAPWADTLLWWVSGRLTWLPLYALMIGLMVWRFGWKKTLVILVGFGVAVGLSDYISSGLIKHWVCRLRPTHDPALQDSLHLVRDYRGGLYGFVSSHAANTMSCALLFSLLWRDWRATVPLMLWVALNCYSRMYLGVHYPLDILGGLCVGTVMAYIVYRLLCKLLPELNPSVST